MKEKQSFGGTGGSEKTEYRVIVAGSREFEQYSIVTKELDHFLSSLPSAGKITIVVGGCRGADALGERYAYEHDYDLQVFPAEWEKYGKSAGPIRNRSMAKYAASDHAKGVLFAFWDGVSRGTAEYDPACQRLSAGSTCDTNTVYPALFAKCLQTEPAFARPLFLKKHINNSNIFF